MGRNFTLTCVKTLFAEASTCAYPGCNESPIYRDNGATTVNAEIAHIRSESDRGPRFDPNYPVQFIDDPVNLLLLCPKHHAVVDRNETSFSVDELEQWQRSQRSAANPGALLNEANAKTVSDADWVPMDVEEFAAISSSSLSMVMIFKALSVGLIKIFGEKPKTFTIVATIVPLERDDATFPLFVFQSHEREALKKANDDYREVMRSVLELRLGGAEVKDVSMSEEFQQFEASIAPWNISVPDRIESGSWTPVRISYEPTLRKIAFDRLEGRNNLRMYRSRLADTSDALEFIAAVTSHGIGVIESIDALSERPAALRMAMYLLDHHQIDLSRFRIVRDSPEEWDYMYPEFDMEIEEQRQR